VVLSYLIRELEIRVHVVNQSLEIDPLQLPVVTIVIPGINREGDQYSCHNYYQLKT
jgi:hypothetical protein